MNNTMRLLERARSLCDPPTYYRLAKVTGISTPTLSRVKTHGKTLDNRAAFALAKHLGMSAADVIAYLEEDRAPTPELREFWRHQLPRLLPAVTITAALIAATPSRTEAAAAQVTAYTLCVLPPAARFGALKRRAA